MHRQQNIKLRLSIMANSQVQESILYLRNANTYATKFCHSIPVKCFKSTYL